MKTFKRIWPFVFGGLLLGIWLPPINTLAQLTLALVYLAAVFALYNPADTAETGM